MPIVRPVRGLAVALLFALMPLAAAAEGDPQELSDIVVTDLLVLPYDIIELHDKPKIFGEIREVVKGEKLVFRRQDSNIVVTAPWSKVKNIEVRKTAEEVVTLRGQELIKALAYPNLQQSAETEVARLKRWAEEREVLGAAREAVVAAHDRNPENPILLEAVVDLLLALNETTDLERILRRGIDSKPTWRRGYEELAKLLRQAGRSADLHALADIWIQHQPTNATVNTLMAQMAEDDGDIQGAQEAYRKLYAHHNQLPAGLQYARICLQRGDVRHAVETVEEILVTDPTLPGLAVVAGSSYLKMGEVDRARSMLLDPSVDAGDDPELALLLAYNRAWLLWQDGQRQQAREIWAGLDHPAAVLASSLVQRRVIRDQQVLNDPALGPVAREINACLLLEQEQPEQAKRLIGEPSTERLLTLDRIASMQAANYEMSAVQGLGDRHDRDAILWRSYGLIKNGAFEQALRSLAALPEDDGYAAIYRLFCAEALDNEEQAANWYQIALKAKGTPRQYLNHLTAFYYRSKNDQEIHEPFDWPAGEVLDVGWFREARGTNITIRATGEDLSFKGIQTASKQPISRVWVVRPRADVRRFAATVRPGETAGAVGMELLDEAGDNGIAVAAVDGQRLMWRRLRDGSWSEFQPLLDQVPENWGIWIDAEQQGDQQVQLMTSREHVPITSLYDLPSEMLRLGFFVESAVGAVVDCHFDDMRIQLHRPDEQADPAPAPAPAPRTR